MHNSGRGSVVVTEQIRGQLIPEELDVPRTANQCRRKWDSLLDEYKKIIVRSRTFPNSQTQTHTDFFPPNFDREHFKAIHDFVMSKDNRFDDTDPDSDTDPEADFSEAISQAQLALEGLHSEILKLGLLGGVDVGGDCRTTDNVQTRDHQRPQSMMTGSSGLIVQTSVNPTMLAVTSHARQWWQIKAPKFVSFPVFVRGQDSVPGDRGQLESDKCELRNKIQAVAWVKIRRDQRRQKRVESRLFELQTAAFRSAFL
ncbi:hypothetical protein WN943_026115 [Citrus x changshan-huyou]